MLNDRKTIILGMPQSFGIHKTFKSRLQQLGFNVVDLSYRDDGFKYKNVWDRFVNLIRKNLFNDKGYKNRLKFRSLGKHVICKLSHLNEKADFVLIIRPDIYPKEILEEIISYSRKSIAYQWDGLARYPAVRELVSLFDIFYVFQEESVNVQAPNLRPHHNFFFGHLYDSAIPIEKGSFFFIGSFIKSRWRQIVDTAKLIADNGGAVNFLLFTEDTEISKNYSCAGVSFIHQPVDYEDSVSLVLKSECIVDFLVADHQGLSIRVFESLGYRRKLLTNNPLVKEYDFYHPNNIYILGHESRALKEFLTAPYEDRSRDLIEKYNFDSWCLNMLGTES